MREEKGRSRTRGGVKGRWLRLLLGVSLVGALARFDNGDVGVVASGSCVEGDSGVAAMFVCSQAAVAAAWWLTAAAAEERSGWWWVGCFRIKSVLLRACE